MLHNISLRDGASILEPSAGVGLLADGIIRKNPNVALDCVELNKECQEELKKKGYNLVGSDFFRFTPDKLYDYVIGAPTFKDNIDVEHIKKMYECTRGNGHIVSITSPYWLTGNTERQVNFRKWLEDKTYSLEMLPDFSYIENGETVPTAIIHIEKIIS